MIGEAVMPRSRLVELPGRAAGRSCGAGGGRRRAVEPGAAPDERRGFRLDAPSGVLDDPATGSWARARS